MRILVIGDCMIDRYWMGEVHRLSQEAPVPVVKMGDEDLRIGAAANVAANCAALGAQVTLVGITGNDEAAETFFGLLIKKGINAHILTDPSIRTTQKVRIIGRNQQIVRVDFEERPGASITKKALEQIKEHDIIVFSDYDKGALDKIEVLIEYAKSLGRTVLVDPKSYNYARYAGADLVKPNQDEMRVMAGGWGTEEQLTEKVNRLRSECHIGTVLLTRAAHGMTLYDGDSFHIPAKAREVFDVTGAGDTVMAALAVMLAEGADLLQAAKVANYAAGIAVSHFGTYAVSRKELVEAIENESRLERTVQAGN